MGSMIAGAATAGCSFICCGACNSCSKAQTGAVSRIPYIFLFFVSSIFAIIMSLYGEKAISVEWSSFKVCNSDSCDGNASVFRVSFALFIFELIHVIVITKATAFHYLFFPIKFLCFMIVLILFFTLGGMDSIFNEWAEIARGLSALYLLIQILIFISWAYDSNEYLRERGNQEVEYNEEHEFSQRCCCECIPGNGYYWCLGIMGIGSYVITFTCLGVFYLLYDHGSNCQDHETIISLAIVLSGLTATFASIRGDGSFGTAGMICFYCMFLTFQALNADPDDSCNLFHRSKNSLSLWFGFLITFASLFYAAMRSDMMAILGKNPHFVEEDQINDEKDTALLVGKENKQEAIRMDTAVDITSAQDTDDIEMDSGNYEDNAKINDSNYNDVDSKSTVADEDDDVMDQATINKRSNLYFHIVMMLASAYMAMLFTNWGTATNSIQTVGTISLWVGVGCSWVAFFCFWWTLAAPKCFPNRFPSGAEE